MKRETFQRPTDLYLELLSDLKKKQSYHQSKTLLCEQLKCDETEIVKKAFAAIAIVSNTNLPAVTVFLK